MSSSQGGRRRSGHEDTAVALASLTSYDSVMSSAAAFDDEAYWATADVMNAITWASGGEARTSTPALAVEAADFDDDKFWAAFDMAVSVERVNNFAGTDSSRDGVAMDSASLHQQPTQAGDSVGFDDENFWAEVDKAVLSAKLNCGYSVGLGAAHGCGEITKVLSVEDIYVLPESLHDALADAGVVQEKTDGAAATAVAEDAAVHEDVSILGSFATEEVSAAMPRVLPWSGRARSGDCVSTVALETTKDLVMPAARREPGDVPRMKSAR